MIFKKKQNSKEFPVFGAKAAGLFVLFLFFSLVLKSQNANLILNKEILNRYEGLLSGTSVDFHTSIKPYQWKDLKVVQGADSINKSLVYKGKKPFWYAFRNASIIEYVGSRVSFSIDPYVGLKPGINLGDFKSFFGSEIGARGNLQLGEKFFFSSTAIYGKSGFVDYIDTLTRQSNVIIGNGYANISGNGYKYHNYLGYASYSPSKYFNFQAGSDRHFIGDGYRSLLLSDNARNYPFLKITTSVWKLKYVNLFTSMQDIRFSEGNRSKYVNKYATTHYLSWNVSSRINIGFFESVIFENRDSTKKFGYDINYLNPVIFYRPVEYGMGSADNALIGLNYKLKLTQKMQVYGQFMIDEFLLNAFRAEVKKLIHPNDSTLLTGWWANKYGIQFGYKWFDVLKIKNLQIQTEFNYVRPYTYSHGSIYQNYGHFNQALAHPLGANFIEGLFFLRYYLKNTLFELKYMNARYGADYSGLNVGRDIFNSYNVRPSDYGNVTTQGLKTSLSYIDFKINYLINPKSSLTAELGISNRTLVNSLQTLHTNYIYFGLRTSISNLYYDK